MAKKLITNEEQLQRIVTIREYVDNCAQETVSLLLDAIEKLGTNILDEGSDAEALLNEAETIKNAAIDYTIEVTVLNIDNIINQCKDGQWLVSFYNGNGTCPDTPCILSYIEKVTPFDVNLVNYRVYRENAVTNAMNKVLTGVGDENTPIVEQPIKGEVIKGHDPCESVVELDPYILNDEEAQKIMNDIFLKAPLFKDPSQVKTAVKKLLNI